MHYKPLGKTDINIPPILFGTSCLGNLYKALDWGTKLGILKAIFENMQGPATLDTAGKYGAGMALEVIGKGLKELDIPHDRVQISNKLGWYQTPLQTSEPTFEPGAWADLEHDAVQKISSKGILDCWQQGCELLGSDHAPQILSVHDPDEYMAAAYSPQEKKKAFQDILDAYATLVDLKQSGAARAIGVGAKDWRVIRDICREIELDWVMLAVSFSVYTHPSELMDFIDELTDKGISIINSAVFHAGFLTGGQYFDYRIPDKNNSEDKPLFEWRERFFAICNSFEIKPAAACVQFGLSHPGIISVALNTSNPKRVKENIDTVLTEIPVDFWTTMQDEGLIDKNYPYLK